MNFKTIKTAALAALPAIAAAAVSLLWTPAHAAIIISEVAPWSSGNSPVAADWFELTNTGSTAVSISGWAVDDNSNSFTAALVLRNITNIAPGQSVVFVEVGAATTDAATNAAFINNWFGGAAPAGFQIGNYSGTGIGLSTAGDAVNIFNAAGALVTRVDYGASTPVPSLATFDNTAGLNNVTLSQFSAVGVNGAFLVTNSLGNTEVGSPGRVAAVPEVGSATMVLAGLLGVGALVRKRQA